MYLSNKLIYPIILSFLFFAGSTVYYFVERDFYKEKYEKAVNRYEIRFNKLKDYVKKDCVNY